MSIQFNDCVKVINNRDLVVLANLLNGKWIRVPKKIYMAIQLIIEDNKKEDIDIEDTIFLEDLKDKLLKLEILVDSEYKKVPQNKIVSLELTHRCNLMCSHCCIDADGVKSEKKDLSTEQIKSIIDKLIKWNPNSIMLSGGECMLREDFLEILIYLREHYLGFIIVSTNGTLINENNSIVLSQCSNQIDISLDGIDEETCSVVRGKGVFDKVINGVKELQRNKFLNISLSMAIADRNEHLESEFKKLNEKLGTKPFIRLFAPIGRGKKNEQLFSNLGDDSVYLPKDFFVEEDNNFIKARNCSAGRREIFISYNGDIYPCPSFIKKDCLLGNIMDVEDLSIITDKNRASICKMNQVEEYSLINNEKCKNCNINIFCCVCPGSLETYTYKQFHKYCELVKPVITKRVWGN